MDRQEELHKIKMIPFVSFLEEWGFTPDKVQGSRSWYKALNRDEETASVCVYTKSFYDDYFDYGTKSGGSIIDFCCKQMGLDYVEAVRMLRKYIE